MAPGSPGFSARGPPPPPAPDEACASIRADGPIRHVTLLGGGPGLLSTPTYYLRFPAHFHLHSVDPCVLVMEHVRNYLQSVNVYPTRALRACDYCMGEIWVVSPDTCLILPSAVPQLGF